MIDLNWVNEIKMENPNQRQQATSSKTAYKIPQNCEIYLKYRDQV